MPQQQERQTAKLTTAEELNSGRYFEREGFEPNYLLTPEGRRISRARIVATVVDSFVNEEGSYGSLTVDDGTDTVQLKFFQDLDQMERFEVGDIVEAVGKVREYQGRVYMNAELLREREVESELLHSLRHRKTMEEWDSTRKTVKQLEETGKSQEDIEKEMAGRLKEEEVDALLQSFGESFDSENEMEERKNLEKEVVEAVESLDDGEGATYSDIEEEVDSSEQQLEDTINSLLSDGTFYEPEPGRLKKL